ncbi:MAG TPA: TIM-barrel domain-containing protein [Casimicrobiaceae bacterium]|jgi:alpha-D-xyloside xylohydrolase|nr:TIM-barrel domain-containing protein [Casimicrobiaceae bacterium]
MQLDPSAYLRLEAPHSLGKTASGASFATSSGDILEITAFGPGLFRLRVGPTTRPDYGIVTGRAKPCQTTQLESGAWSFTSGDATLEVTGVPLRVRLLWRGSQVLESITDEHFRGFTRLPTFGRLRQGGLWTAALALSSGEPVYGLGEKFGPLDKRGQLIHSHVEDALGVNTGLSYKNTPFAWSTGTGRGAWGVFVHTPGMVTHGVGYPDWSHRSYAFLVEDEALDMFLMAADTPASILDLYTQLTGRAPEVPRWSLGLWVSRAYYKTPEEAIDVAIKLRERKVPCDVLTLDGRAAWNVETRFDFQWDPSRFGDTRGMLGRIKAHNLRLCVWEYPYVSIHSPLFQELASRRYLLTTEQGDPYVFGWDTSPSSSPFGKVLTPLPESGILDFTNPAAFAWWRDAHQALFDDGVDAIKSDFGEQVPDDAVAFNGDRGRRLHNVYPLLYNRCVYEATARFKKDPGPPIVWSRAAWSGSQRYPIGWGGDPQADWEGLAASIRGGLSWGMSGNPYHSSDIGGFYGSHSPDAELYVRWMQASVFTSHMRLHGIGEREPWAFGAEAEAIARKWLALRYRLIPYLERVVKQASRTGLPVTRAMALAFPASALTRDFDTQFMCGEALLVAPIVQPGGEVDIALPPGAWYDLNTRQRYAGRQVLRYKAKLDQFPVFGREGYALPLGRAVQHTGEIDAAKPLESLWVFGPPAHSLDGFTQTRIDADGEGGFTLRAAGAFDVQVFGSAAVDVQRM